MRGISFPLTIDPSKKNLLVVSDADLLQGHIRSWLQTDKDSRVMRPSYGLSDYLFQAVPNIAVITSEVQAGLEQYVPDCQFEVSGEINGVGEAEVTVYWTWRGEDQQALKVTI